MGNPHPSNPIKPGESRNPHGRPKKGYSITDWFKNMLNSKPEVKEAMGTAILKKALQGDVTAQKIIWQYMDGMPVQKNILAGDEENPVKIDVGGTLEKIYGDQSSSPRKVRSDS